MRDPHAPGWPCPCPHHGPQLASGSPRKTPSGQLHDGTAQRVVAMPRAHARCSDMCTRDLPSNRVFRHAPRSLSASLCQPSTPALHLALCRRTHSGPPHLRTASLRQCESRMSRSTARRYGDGALSASMVAASRICDIARPRVISHRVSLSRAVTPALPGHRASPRGCPYTGPGPWPPPSHIAPGPTSLQAADGVTDSPKACDSTALMPSQAVTVTALPQTGQLGPAYCSGLGPCLHPLPWLACPARHRSPRPSTDRQPLRPSPRPRYSEQCQGRRRFRRQGPYRWPIQYRVADRDGALVLRVSCHGTSLVRTSL